MSRNKNYGMKCPNIINKAFRYEQITENKLPYKKGYFFSHLRRFLILSNYIHLKVNSKKWK